MNKIYIVTSGSYSDYEIKGVFSTRELAQKYLDKFEEGKYPDHGIEEYELDKPIWSYDKSLYWVFAIYEEEDYRTGKCSRIENVGLSEDTIGIKPIDVMDCEHGKGDRFRRFEGIVHAKDKAHALKILGEFTFSYNTQNPLPWLK